MTATVVQDSTYACVLAGDRLSLAGDRGHVYESTNGIDVAHEATLRIGLSDCRQQCKLVDTGH